MIADFKRQSRKMIKIIKKLPFCSNRDQINKNNTLIAISKDLITINTGFIILPVRQSWRCNYEN
jgi:hypothetical protein